MEKIFFDSWESIIRTFVIGVFSYMGLIVMLRLVGNRTLSQLNAFDLIVTVALGSTLATVILSKNVALADGLLAMAMLIALQFGISWVSVRFKRSRKLFKTDPFLLYFRGRYLDDALLKHRITKDEILQVARSSGISSLEEVEAIVLETNGHFSVMKKLNESGRSTLENVVGPRVNGNT